MKLPYSHDLHRSRTDGAGTQVELHTSIQDTDSIWANQAYAALWMAYYLSLELSAIFLGHTTHHFCIFFFQFRSLLWQFEGKWSILIICDRGDDFISQQCCLIISLTVLLLCVLWSQHLMWPVNALCLGSKQSWFLIYLFKNPVIAISLFPSLCAYEIEGECRRQSAHTHPSKKHLRTKESWTDNSHVLQTAAQSSFEWNCVWLIWTWVFKANLWCSQTLLFWHRKDKLHNISYLPDIVRKEVPVGDG